MMNVSTCASHSPFNSGDPNSGEPNSINMATLVVFILNTLVYWGTKIKKRLQSNEVKIDSLQRKMSQLTRASPSDRERVEA